MDRSPQPLARNVTRLSHLDLPGAGQVYVAGDYAYIGHIPNKQKLGTSILDVRDPKSPKIVSQISLEDPDSHSHKARVIGDVMIVNSERNMTPIGRRAEELPRLRARLRESLKREPSHAELAEKLGIKESDIPMVEAAERNPYAQGGFRVYDVKDRTKPRLLAFHKTGGKGVHRFDMDASYAYISTEMEGYVGNILVIYDLKRPEKPEEVARWWMPGQHLAVRARHDHIDHLFDGHEPVNELLERGGIFAHDACILEMLIARHACEENPSKLLEIVGQPRSPYFDVVPA